MDSPTDHRNPGVKALVAAGHSAKVLLLFLRSSRYLYSRIIYTAGIRVVTHTYILDYPRVLPREPVALLSSRSLSSNLLKDFVVRNLHVIYLPAV